jgi:hypothetical protein
MKTTILRVSITVAVAMCAMALLAKEPRTGSGNAGGGRNDVQGKGPDQGRTDVRGQANVRSNVNTLGKENLPSSQGKASPQVNHRTDGERQRTDGVSRDNWRYRQNGNLWWYWTDNRWLYWQNDRWVGTSVENNQNESSWRYRWYDGRWWYWTTANRWLYWDDSQWVASS